MTGEVSKFPGKIPEHSRLDPPKKADAAKKDPVKDKTHQIGTESLTPRSLNYAKLTPEERIYVPLPAEEDTAQKVEQTAQSVISRPLPFISSHPPARRPPPIPKLVLPPGKTKADFTLLGSGSFGEVRLAQTLQGDPVAIKYRKQDTDAKEEQEEAQNFENEVELHQSIKHHPNILRCYGKTEDGGCVLEYVDAGDLKETPTGSSDLQSCLSVIKALPSERRRVVEKQIVKDIFSGMAHLESQKVFHRDLAARNVLLGKLDGGYRARIADFGLARTISHARVTESEGVIKYKSNSNNGPLKWMAPETIVDRTSNTKSDVFACAVTVWEILSGELPHPDLSAIQVACRVANAGNQLNFDAFIKDGVNPDFIALMKKCGSKDPAERPTFGELVEFMQTHELYLSPEQQQINVLKGEIRYLQETNALLNSKLIDLEGNAYVLKVKVEKSKNVQANLEKLAAALVEIKEAIETQNEIAKMLREKDQELAKLINRSE